MINLEYSFEKKKLNKNKNSQLMLLDIFGFKNKKEDEKIERKKLNLCLCLDISGSMGDDINKSNNYKFFENNKTNEIYKSKLELTKIAAKKAISRMKDGDIVSIVEFDDSQNTVLKPTILDKENRIIIENIISNLRIKGATNIHDAWLESVKNIAENINPKNINRVILLTDGNICAGERNTDVICTNVRNMADKQISTSTFGVGEDFNESLLKSMSDSGNGNFYYIEDEKTFESMFEEEFTGVSNIVATNVKLTFDGIKIDECFNDIQLINGEYILGDISSISKSSLLFKINTKSKKTKSNIIGSVNLEFTNIEGKKVNQLFEIKAEFVEQKEWESLEDNKEIKVHEILIEIAKNKKIATNAYKNGDRISGSSILRKMAILADESGISDARVFAASTSLTNTLNKSDLMSDDALSKSLHYESYRTLKGK